VVKSMLLVVTMSDTVVVVGMVDMDVDVAAVCEVEEDGIVSVVVGEVNEELEVVEVVSIVVGLISSVVV